MYDKSPKLLHHSHPPISYLSHSLLYLTQSVLSLILSPNLSFLSFSTPNLSFLSVSPPNLPFLSFSFPNFFFLSFSLPHCLLYISHSLINFLILTAPSLLSLSFIHFTKISPFLSLSNYFHSICYSIKLWDPPTTRVGWIFLVSLVYLQQCSIMQPLYHYCSLVRPGPYKADIII